MLRVICPVLLLLFLLTGCMGKTAEPVAVTIPDHVIDYQAEVKPLLDRRCVVCHSCYNSPCQLKLSSYEGVDRGGSKKAVYDSTRLQTMDPTRLFIDAQSTEDWRQKSFFAVTESDAEAGYNNSLMLQLLTHKIKDKRRSGLYVSEREDLTCAENGYELGSYLQSHQNNGMPFGFPPLTDQEFAIIAGWLVQGAKGPGPEEQAALVRPSRNAAAALDKWEAFLNMEDAKHVMTARYLYEHLFLAHISFETGGREFFELVRSRTPSGAPIDLINSLRPYDSPEVARFYYRFRKIHSTIVHKTHMVFSLDDAQLQRFHELFLEPEWLQEPHRMGYEAGANPFVVFEQIPPRSRYQFLLDNSHYITMTFIRGPVCRGQVALNVIHDHFWLLFLDPDYDLSVQYPAFLRWQKDNLIMPIEKGSKFPVINLFEYKYHKAVMRYFQARQEFYGAHYYNGLGYDAIWKGDRPQDAPLLTVYRHFDSASVHKGVLGELPDTMWVIDYPLFERIYYALVAGFDVFGTLGHQLAVRVYMDTLRVEGESYFLDFLPREQRKEMISSWYQGVPYTDIHTFTADMESGISFSTERPKQEFIEHVVNEEIRPDCEIGFDSINYFSAGEEYPPLPESYENEADYLQGFRSISRPGTALFSHFNDHNANLAYVRIRTKDGTDRVGSIVINRYHANVTYMLGEKNALDASKDRADFLPGFVGSYPNYFFDVAEEDLADFLDLLANVHDSEEERGRFLKYGVNRAEDDFWQHYDWFQERFDATEPLTSGRFDLNRYYPKALEL
ncbi:MAG: fatty acid cis/trans isomerase [Proteobacteria bacterium]|nr:fatty acid cis/trans isomerase [Pseudomonadota bacterium]MBU1058842.1 fatty acid cis/trans isomerase [Pseudomonadota bacterium]